MIHKCSYTHKLDLQFQSPIVHKTFNPSTAHDSMICGHDCSQEVPLLWTISNRVLTTFYCQKVCTKCDGYGVQQCHVCEGQGKLIWEGKLRRMDPCPLCFGSCLEKVRFFFFCESSCFYCQRQIAMQLSVCGISQEWVFAVPCSSAALLSIIQTKEYLVVDHWKESVW